MANIKSAKKRARQAEGRRIINASRRSALKTAVNKVLSSIENKEDPKETETLFVEAEKQIARAKVKGVLHKNTAARKISRLAKRCNSVLKPADADSTVKKTVAPKKKTAKAKTSAAKKTSTAKAKKVTKAKK